MKFLFIQSALSGFNFFLTPLMIGARELAFPRLNTFSYYVFLLAGIFLYASFLVAQAPNGSWLGAPHARRGHPSELARNHRGMGGERPVAQARYADAGDHAVHRR